MEFQIKQKKKRSRVEEISLERISINAAEMLLDLKDALSIRSHSSTFSESPLLKFKVRFLWLAD
jgi:hypothetical protein